MEKIKRYIDVYIETETCNLRCHYCYVTQERKFNNKIAKFKYPLSQMQKALSKERLGGICLFNICAGGETLLSDEVIPYVKAILENGHYVGVVTNGILTHRFQELIKLPLELRERLFIKFSYHFLELRAKNLTKTFFNNVKLMKDNSISYTVEITPSDELIPYINEIKKEAMEYTGALPHITVARVNTDDTIPHLSKYSFDKYKKIWSEFESDLFDFKTSIFYHKINEFCYSGDWVLYLDAVNGSYRQCYWGKPLGNLYTDKKIKYLATGNNCLQPHCFNGHAFIALGVVPSIGNETNYARLRNRKCKDGSEFLTPKMKEFMSNKLIENNKEYSALKKYIANYKTRRREKSKQK
jgi:pyruvate-formate lyase-activating enzyme